MTENSRIVKDKVYQEVAALAKQGMSNAAISRRIGRSPSHVLWMRKKLGLVNSYNQEREEKRQAKLDRIRALWEQGKNDTEISEIIGLSAPYVCQFRREMGLKAHDHRITTAESETIKQQVHALWKEGKTDSEVADILRIGRKRVCYFRKHVLQLEPNRDLEKEKENRTRWANRSWQGEEGQPEILEEREENGVKVVKYKPMFAHGAEHFRRYYR